MGSKSPIVACRPSPPPPMPTESGSWFCCWFTSIPPVDWDEKLPSGLAAVTWIVNCPAAEVLSPEGWPGVGVVLDVVVDLLDAEDKPMDLGIVHVRQIKARRVGGQRNQLAGVRRKIAAGMRIGRHADEHLVERNGRWT